jgi:hypothetical protein
VIRWHNPGGCDLAAAVPRHNDMPSLVNDGGAAIAGSYPFSVHALDPDPRRRRNKTPAPPIQFELWAALPSELGEPNPLAGF